MLSFNKEKKIRAFSTAKNLKFGETENFVESREVANLVERRKWANLSRDLHRVLSGRTGKGRRITAETRATGRIQSQPEIVVADVPRTCRHFQRSGPGAEFDREEIGTSGRKMSKGRIFE